MNHEPLVKAPTVGETSGLMLTPQGYITHMPISIWKHRQQRVDIDCTFPHASITSAIGKFPKNNYSTSKIHGMMQRPQHHSTLENPIGCAVNQLRRLHTTETLFMQPSHSHHTCTHRQIPFIKLMRTVRHITGSVLALAGYH
jgi:hypothetical protein